MEAANNRYNIINQSKTSLATIYSKYWNKDLIFKFELLQMNLP